MAALTMNKSRILYIVAPSGQKGGGMGRVKDYILQSGGDCYGRIEFKFLDTRGKGHAVWSLYYLALAIARIWLTAACGKLAGVHVNFGDRGSGVRKGLVVLFSRAIGAPVILHLHAAELIEHYKKSSSMWRWCIRLPFRAATCCIVLGWLWRDWLVNDLGIGPTKVEIVYNGVPAPGRFRIPESFNAPGPRQILFLGNLMERKGVSDLLHACGLLPSAGPDWHATLVGGGNIDHYKAMTESLKISGKVTFAGWKDQAEVRHLLSTTDVLVLPSYDEGLPLVILEALGCGAPVLTTPVGAIPEVLKNDYTVLFVNPGDRKALAEKLSLMICDAGLRRRLSDAGMRLFQEKFTLDAFLDSLFDVYRRHCHLPIERAKKAAPDVA